MGRGSQVAIKLQVAIRKHSEERDHLGSQLQHFVGFFFSRELKFDHVEFEMSIRYLSRNCEWAVDFICLGLRREGWVAGVNSESDRQYLTG